MGKEAPAELLERPGVFFGFDVILQECGGWFVTYSSHDGNEHVVDTRAKPWRVHQAWPYPYWGAWFKEKYSYDGKMFVWAEGNKMLARAVDPIDEQPPCQRILSSK
nr:hypothetical protein [Candidatus Sigynarchaeum springense]